MFHVKHQGTAVPNGDLESMISKRLFWWSASELTNRWRPLYRGTDENCNRTLGLRLPGGVLFVCLNVPLRQSPCGECST